MSARTFYTLLEVEREASNKPVELSTSGSALKPLVGLLNDLYIYSEPHWKQYPDTKLVPVR